ncbi:MAG: murein biosynthesis integral membrane protein MurJ [Deltaproteobacteria bacterium RBG_16_44_11]|nr:MAG: murein biosynthesis integral membrane protein MurJ [Deltaproteobacteria bacterium RBG_16_44_11]
MKQANTSENSKVAKAAGVVGISTMLSRIFGLIRDIVVAAFFGAGWIYDAFLVAFRIPNLLRRIIGEGSLTVSFVPVFTEYLQKKSKDEALELANIAFTLLSIILVIISLLGVLFSPLIVALNAPWFIKTPDQFALAVFLNRLMFPYIFFMSLVALCMGILNSFRHFAAPALSPVILNISMILATLILYDYFSQPIIALAVGVMIGGVLQLAMQWPFLAKFGVKFKFRVNLHHPGIKQIAILILPAMLAAAVNTINVLVGTILASFLPKGSISYLYYADRIMELPLGIFAIAIGTAVLPSFSKHVTNGDFAELKSSISFSLRLMLFVTIPAMIAMMALHLPIISVLFQRGAFDVKAAILTSQALFFYALGLWAFSVIRVIVSTFFSLQDSKWPLKAAVITLVVNFLASLVLMQFLKHNGLALANSLAAVINVIILSVVLKKKIGTFLDRSFYSSVIKIIISSLVMLAALMAVDFFLPWNTNAHFKARLIYLSISIAVGGAAFFVCSYLLKSPEVYGIISLLKKRFTRR